MIKKKGLGFNAITALIMLTTSNCVIAEEYQLPATINNPVVMPVGADGFQNGAAKSHYSGQAGSEQSGAQTNLSEAGNAQGQKPTTDLPTVQLSPASNASPAVSAITGALSNNPSLPDLTHRPALVQLIAMETNRYLFPAECNQCDRHVKKPMNFMSKLVTDIKKFSV